MFAILWFNYDLLCYVHRHFASRIVWVNGDDRRLVLRMLYSVAHFVVSYDILCPDIPCQYLPCYAMPRCAIPCNAMRWYTILHRPVLSCSMHIMLYKIPY